jgi:MtN3 and saliva related transmembrane protein
MATNALGLMGGAITTLSGIPQIHHMYKTRDTKGVGWGMLSMWTTGLTMTTIYGVLINQMPIWLSSSTSLAMTGAMMFIKYDCEKQTEYIQV